MKFLAILFTLLISQSVQKGCGKSEAADGTHVVVPDESTADSTIQTDPAVLEELALTIEKTYCFGTCPVFKAEIYSNGKLLYEGIRYVPDSGKFIGQMDPQIVQGLIVIAQSEGFFEMEDTYDHPQLTDVPSTIIGVRGTNGIKTVTGRYQPPAAFKHLDAFIMKAIEKTELKPAP